MSSHTQSLSKMIRAVNSYATMQRTANCILRLIIRDLMVGPASVQKENCD